MLSGPGVQSWEPAQEVTVEMEAKKPIPRARFLTGSGVMHSKVHYRKRTCRGNLKIRRLECAEQTAYLLAEKGFRIISNNNNKDHCNTC